MKNWPDFLVVGSARAGTTSLQRYLRQHPGLFLPKLKEPCFFSFAEDKATYKHGKFAFAVRDPKKYLDLFETAEKEQVRGEISTPYLYLYEKTIANIRKYHPHADQLKILILLRNPADRAFSQYMWRVRDGREPLSFEEAIAAEQKRKQEGYSFDYFYTDRGFYFSQVKAYLDAFQNVKIVLLDDLKERPMEMLSEICEFLTGKEINIENITEAVSISDNEISPISDARGSAEYKRLLLTRLIYSHFITLFPEIIDINLSV